MFNIFGSQSSKDYSKLTVGKEEPKRKTTMKIDPKTGLPAMSSLGGNSKSMKLDPSGRLIRSPKTPAPPPQSSAFSPLTMKTQDGRIQQSKQSIMKPFMKLDKIGQVIEPLNATEQRLKDMGLLEQYRAVQAKQAGQTSPLNLSMSGGKILQPTPSDYQAPIPGGGVMFKPQPTPEPTPTKHWRETTPGMMPGEKTLSDYKKPEEGFSSAFPGGKRPITPTPEQGFSTAFPMGRPKEPMGGLSDYLKTGQPTPEQPMSTPETPTPAAVPPIEQMTDTLQPSPTQPSMPTPMADTAQALQPQAETLQPGSGITAPQAMDKMAQQQLMGVTDPTKIESIKKEIAEKQSLLESLQFRLANMPGKDPNMIKAVAEIGKDLAASGLGGEQIAEIIDYLLREEDEKLSNLVMPTIKKRLGEGNPEITKAKELLETLYTKYSGKDNEYNDKLDEMNRAIAAVNEGSYLTHAMVVGRQDRMRDEYNMDLSRIMNEKNSIGQDIDRARGALKTLTQEGWKMVEQELGSFKMGIDESVMGRMPFGFRSVLEHLKGQPGGLWGIPETIGAGQFEFKDGQFEQATPFTPKTPTSKGEVDIIKGELEHEMNGRKGEDGHISFENYEVFKNIWVRRTGKSGTKFDEMYKDEYLSEDSKARIETDGLSMLRSIINP